MKSSKKTQEQEANNTRDVMNAVANTVNFIKEQIAIDLLRAKSTGMIDHENDEMQKIVRVIEASITNSFVKSSSQIEQALRK